MPEPRRRPGISNQPPHPTAAPRCGFGFNGFIGRWIRCQCPLPAAVGELTSLASVSLGSRGMQCLVLTACASQPQVPAAHGEESAGAISGSCLPRDESRGSTGMRIPKDSPAGRRDLERQMEEQPRWDEAERLKPRPSAAWITSVSLRDRTKRGQRLDPLKLRSWPLIDTAKSQYRTRHLPQTPCPGRQNVALSAIY
jgi:hypothetical protein